MNNIFNNNLSAIKMKFNNLIKIITGKHKDMKMLTLK